MNHQYIKGVAKIDYDPGKCTGCKMCVIVCPQAVFKMNDKKAVLINRDGCMECGACMLNCIAGAINVSTGVGCATAIINSKLGNKQNANECGCSIECC